jgi:hypothetical protein
LVSHRTRDKIKHEDTDGNPDRTQLRPGMNPAGPDFRKKNRG